MSNKKSKRKSAFESFRKPTAPTTKVFKDKKKYSRKGNKDNKEIWDFSSIAEFERYLRGA